MHDTGGKMSIIKRIKHLLTGVSPEKDAMNEAIKKGFKHGKNFSYNSGYPIDGNWPWLISVGDNVTLATGVKLLAHDASTARISGVHTKIGIVEIGNNVFIGANSIVLPNVRIGDNVVVAAGSVVTKDIPSNNVYGGVPAKRICSFDEYAEKHRENRKTHPTFGEHRWDEWINASQEEREAMKEKLKDTFGYL